MTQDDSIFWDRLAEMPFEEHEQECVLRRENLILQRAVLRQAKSQAVEAGDKPERDRIVLAIDEVEAQLSLVNERIKYVRRLIDTISWKNAVKKVLGEDVYEELLVWRAQEEGRQLPILRSRELE